MRRQASIRQEAADARRAWEDAATRVDVWSRRTWMLDGPERLQLLARHVPGPVTFDLSWTNLMGARLPATGELTLPDPPTFSALGGSSAAVLLEEACREAAGAAARHATAQRAQAELSAELARAVRRLRALQERWIPEHEQALARLDLALDESQREQAARLRWLTGRR
jgi:V/A-type H+/Na+-transporting ATPase subunit D